MSDSLTSNSLYVSVFDEEDIGHQYLKLNTRNFLKFYTKNDVITYSPAEITYKFVESKNSDELSVIGAKIKITVKGYDYSEEQPSEKVLSSSTVTQTIENQEYKYTFPAVLNNPSQLTDISSITFETFIQKSTNSEPTRIGYEEILVMYGTTNDMAKFNLAVNGITMAINEAGLLFDANGLTIQNGNFTIKNKTGASVFEADTEGNLSFTGKINSSLGQLSGWDLSEYDIQDKTKNVGLHSGDTRFYLGDDDSPVRFWAGVPQKKEATIGEDDTGITKEKYNFAVTSTGTLYANNAKVNGRIEATEGRILGQFFVGPNNDTGIVMSGTENDSFIGSMQYASGALGGGWKINSDGSAEFNDVSIRGKITSSVFEYNHISAVGGSLYIAPTVYAQKSSKTITKNKEGKYEVAWELDTSVNDAFGGRELHEGNRLLLDGCIVAETLINNEIQTIMTYLSNIEATINKKPENNILSVSFEYSNNDLTGKVFEPGTTIIFYGTSENREGLYLTAMGKDSPYLDVYSFSSNTETSSIPAVRLGNLAGITDANFSAAGSRLSGYGLYSNNAYLRGQLMLPNAGITNQTDKIDLDGSAIRIWAGLPNNEEKDIRKAYFRVTQDGTLYAEKGRFKGVVEATNSEFSGNIRAAGILLEEKDISSTDALHDHFYVAYNILENGTFTPSYKNYILNIDKDGLSIWEGGLQAYSDVANDNLDKDIYSAYSHKNGSAFPYFYLVDSKLDTDTELNSRIVVNKLHSLNFTPQSSGGQIVYNVTSTQINNGVWLANKSITVADNNYKEAESTLFQNNKLSGLTLEDTKLILKNNVAKGYITISAPFGIQMNMDNFDTSKYSNNVLTAGGNIQIVTSATNKAELKINSSVVQEAKSSNGATIGLNFIAVS